MALRRDFIAVNRLIWGIGNPAFLASQLEAESRWVDGLTSRAAARGICQFIEPTARAAESKWADLVGLGTYSIKWCLRAQSLLMREEFDRYKPGRGECSALLFSASAYNGGPTRLNAEIALCREDEWCDPSRWFGHVSTKRARANWAIAENRPYVERIYDREDEYADAGFGALVCR